VLRRRCFHLSFVQTMSPFRTPSHQKWWAMDAIDPA
jgi:hypothetical protein